MADQPGIQVTRGAFLGRGGLRRASHGFSHGFSPPNPEENLPVEISPVGSLHAAEASDSPEKQLSFQPPSLSGCNPPSEKYSPDLVVPPSKLPHLPPPEISLCGVMENRSTFELGSSSRPRESSPPGDPILITSTPLHSPDHNPPLADRHGLVVEQVVDALNSTLLWRPLNG